MEDKGKTEKQISNESQRNKMHDLLCPDGSPNLFSPTANSERTALPSLRRELNKRKHYSSKDRSFHYDGYFS